MVGMIRLVTLQPQRVRRHVRLDRFEERLVDIEGVTDEAFQPVAVTGEEVRQRALAGARHIVFVVAGGADDVPVVRLPVNAVPDSCW